MASGTKSIGMIRNSTFNHWIQGTRAGSSGAVSSPSGPVQQGGDQPVAEHD